jgi:HNH endonuclease
MISGYLWAKSATTRKVIWHFWRGNLSLCGGWIDENLTADQLEPAPVDGLNRHYCGACARLLAVEAAKGLPPEPALAEAEKGIIEQLWPTHTAKEIAAILGRKNEDKVKFFAKRYGGTKLDNPAKSGRFQKGQVPHTARPDVHEFLRKDQRGVPYWHVRGGKFGYQYKHIRLWEDANGPVPKTHVVAFKDGDSLNCVLENLELLTKADNLARNSGRAELTNLYVARRLAQQGRGIVDQDVVAAVLAIPELLEVKRNQLRLKRALKDL